MMVKPPPASLKVMPAEVMGCATTSPATRIDAPNAAMNARPQRMTTMAPSSGRDAAQSKANQCGKSMWQIVWVLCVID